MNLKKIASFAFGPICGAFLSFITLPITTWFFSVEDIGRLTMLNVAIGFGLMFFSLGLHQSYVREYHEEEDKPALLKMAVFPGACLLSLFVAVFIVYAPSSISKIFFDVESVEIGILFLLVMVFSFISYFLTHVLRMQERGLAFSLSQILPKLFFLLSIGILIFLRVEASFTNLLFLNAVSITVSMIVFLLLTKNDWFPAVKKPVEPQKMIKMLGFSLPLIIGSFAHWGLTAADRFFLKSFGNLEQLGVYSVSVSIASAGSIFASIFSSLWHPTLYRWVKEGVDLQKVQSVSEYVLLGVSFLWSMAGILSFLVPMLLPKKYCLVPFLFVACFASPLLYVLSETTMVGIGITRKSQYAMLASILAFGINFAINYFAIPIWGASAAAMASMIAFFFFFLIRTESSAMLWNSQPRAKIYLVIIIYLATTILWLFRQDHSLFFSLLWLLPLCIAMLIFRYRAFELIDIFFKAK